MTTYEQEQSKQQTGAFSWKDRLLENITFVSPSGITFVAKWRKDERTIEKKVGIFDFPGVDGSIVQDLGTKGATYPITFFFDGPQHDLLAESFVNAMLERGRWTVEHPVHGFIELQPLQFKEVTDPQDSGNITQFDSNWIEPLDEETLLTTRQLYGVIEDLLNELNAASGQSYVNETDTSEYGVEAAAAIQMSRNADTSSKALESLYNKNDEIASEVRIAKTGIESVTNNSPLETGDLAGFSQALLQKSALGTSDIGSRLDTFGDLTDELISSLPSGNPTRENKNKIVGTQLNLLSIVASNAQIIRTGDLGTRSEAVQAALNLIDNWETITDALDEAQTDYLDNPIDYQYFSQTDTFTITGKLVTAAVQFILAASFDLQIEKKFVLKEPKTPAQIVAEEHGTLGQTGREQDLIDKFISSNDLKGNDILWLDAGREVVIYI